MWHFVSQYLLLEAEELELKNFGKFVAKVEKAKIDEDKKVVSPAKRIFSFVQLEPEKTSEQFVEYLSKVLNKSPKETQKYIEQEIEKAKDLLGRGEKVELPLIGYLQKKDKTIQLSQTVNYSLEPDNFGFTDIPLPPEVEKEVLKTTTAPKQKKKVSPKKKTNTKNLLKAGAYLLGIAAVIALFVFLYKPVLNLTKTFTQNIKNKQQTVSEEKIETDTLTQIAQNTGEENTAIDTATTVADTEATQIESQPITEKPQVDEEQLLAQVDMKAHISLGPGYKKYYLIVGSFSMLENAEKFRQQLISEGYGSAGILTADPQHKRVYIDGLDDLQQAVELYKQYKQRYPKRGIWLLIND